MRGVAIPIAREPLRAAEIVQFAQAQIRQTAVACKLRNPADAKISRNAQSVCSGRCAGRVFLAVAKAHLVDEAGRKDVGVANGHTVHVNVCVPSL